MNTQSRQTTGATAEDNILEVVARHAPILWFDLNEPFLPEALGYSIHEDDGPSASAEHPVRLKGAKRAIEYSVWWDWDIQHLYELEHIWLYLDRNNEIERVEASSHGCVSEMWRNGGELPVVDGRVSLFSEPGKHAFAADAESLRAQNYAIATCCGELAGQHPDTILVPEFLAEKAGRFSVYDRHVALNFMKSKAFKPAFRFDRRFDLRDVTIVPWSDLKASIPARLRSELSRLRDQAKGVKAVFLDSGDTLINEDTEAYIKDELVLQADPIPGGDRLVSELKSRGYLVALVADGLVESFENVHRALGFWDMFDAKAISEEVGVHKPDARMFKTAAERLGLAESDYPGCVMVGNNLARDIAGANRLGMQTVWINWTKNYPSVPDAEDEQPDYVIKLPHELIDVLERIRQRE